MTDTTFTAPPCIDPEEVAFAIALLVAAANGNVSLPNTKTSDVHLSKSADRSEDALLAGARSVLANDKEPFNEEIPLTRAVSVIWQHYTDDDRRQAICSRLVALLLKSQPNDSYELAF